MEFLIGLSKWMTITTNTSLVIWSLSVAVSYILLHRLLKKWGDDDSHSFWSFFVARKKNTP
jgi:hypothetical protein